MDYPLTQTGAEVQELLDSIGPLAGRVTALEGSSQQMTEALATETSEREAADATQDALLEILQKGIGSSSTVGEIAMSKEVNNKAVSWSTQKLITKSGYGVSNTLTLQKGKIYLFPVSSLNASTVAYLSQVVTKTYAKAIVYTYTYKTVDGRRVVDTATADYDETLVYTYSYDASGNLIAIFDKDGAVVPGITLPGTREVTETFYSVLVNRPVISNGKFLYVPTYDMDVVVSHTTANLTGTVEVLDFSLVISLVGSLLGAVQERVLCEAFGLMSKRIDSIEKRLAVQGDVKARSIDLGFIPKVCGREMVIFEETLQEGSFLDGPQSYPSFLGQLCVDTVNNKVFIAYKWRSTYPNGCWYELTLTSNS